MLLQEFVFVAVFGNVVLISWLDFCDFISPFTR